jgi:hypothetical protein
VLPPENLFALVGSTHLSFRAASAAPNPTYAPAIQRTKNLSADLITLNSASQTSVNSQPLYQGRADCQSFYFFFLAGVAQSQLSTIYQYQSRCQKLF